MIDTDESRRRFLGFAVAGGVGAPLPSALSWGQGVRGTGRIDVHHHYQLPFLPAARDWTPLGALEAMDRAGVETSILSGTTFP
jgi:hypothetical protein